MKDRIWLLNLPLILLCASAFWVHELAERGELENKFLRSQIFPYLRSISGKFTNIKFLLRGTEAPKNKIVIVEVDEASLESFGRWPWHRDVTAYLLEQIYAKKPKVVGLDIVFSEPDQRVPDELADLLRKKGMGRLVDSAETDPVLARTVVRHRESLVMGWLTENACQPAHLPMEQCPVSHEEAIATHPPGFDKFAVAHFKAPDSFDPQKTPLMSLVTFVANLQDYNVLAKHSGTFNTTPDSDGYVRRVPLVLFAAGKPYPSLALEMARVGTKEDVAIELDDTQRIREIRWKNSGRAIPTSPLGVMDINFRGPSYSFKYVSAEQIMGESEEVTIGYDRSIASTKTDLLRDAYVLVGVSAKGAFDMRAFPFDSNTPGVEGHATILDNLLSQDMLVASSSSGAQWVLLLMTLLAVALAYASHRLSSIPALGLFAATLFVFGVIDLKVLFENGSNWNTGFFYIEMALVAFFTLMAKYILEEKEKEFIHSAFGRYVSPDMVNAIVDDPSKLQLGGEKRELTILFSDIRGFTTLSEKMDAKFLARFLNDYLGEMTRIIVDETHGTLDKYIGDAIMAFWGAPIPLKDHAAKSCLAAVRMMQQLREMKPHFLKEYGIDVQIGIGINTGLVSVGNMGSEKNFNYTVLGDHVNLASRLEGLTKPYGASIVTTRFAIDQIQRSGAEMLPHRTLDFVKVKGKNEAVELVQILDDKRSDEGLELFTEARELYTKQLWDPAIQKFEAADEMLRNAPNTIDGPSKMYIERCEFFKKNPPKPNWDGSWEMTTK